MPYLRITHFRPVDGKWCPHRAWQITAVLSGPAKNRQSRLTWTATDVGAVTGNSANGDWFQLDFHTGPNDRVVASVGGSECYLQATEKWADPFMIPGHHGTLLRLANIPQPPAASHLNIWLRVPCALLDLHSNPKPGNAHEDGAFGWFSLGLQTFGERTVGWHREGWPREPGVGYISRMGLALGAETWSVPASRRMLRFLDARPVAWTALPWQALPLLSGFRVRAPDIGVGVPRRASTTLDCAAGRILGLQALGTRKDTVTASWRQDQEHGLYRLKFSRPFQTSVASSSAFFRGARTSVTIAQDIVLLPATSEEATRRTPPSGPSGQPVVGSLELIATDVPGPANDLFNVGWRDLIWPEKRNAAEDVNFLFDIHWREPAALFRAFPVHDLLLRSNSTKADLALLARPPLAAWPKDAETSVELWFASLGLRCEAILTIRDASSQDRDGTWRVPLGFTIKGQSGKTPRAIGDLDVWFDQNAVEEPEEFKAELALSPRISPDAWHYPLQVDEFFFKRLKLRLKRVAVGGASHIGNATSLRAEVGREIDRDTDRNARQGEDKRELRSEAARRQRAIAAENPALITPIDIGQQGDGDITLRAEERMDRRRARHLEVSLEATTSAARSKDRLRLLYINQAPFFVGLIEMPGLLNFTREEGNQLAYWSTAGLFRGWQLRAAADSFNLWLPPQGLGEEMEKGRAVEGYDDIGDDELVELRFTPPARLVLNPSDVPRRYASSPWNLQHLLDGLRPNNAPGLPLKQADFEMLYGLRFRLRDLPWVRVAEVSARVGWPRRPLDLDGDFADFRRREGNFRPADRPLVELAARQWCHLLDVYARRLAVYEPYDERHQEFDRNGNRTDLRFVGSAGSSQVKAAIRRQALHNLRPSFPWKAPPLEDPSGGPQPGAASPAPARARRRLPAPSAAGLAGSFAWAYESERLFKALYEDKLDGAPGQKWLRKDVEAVEAVVARLSFSALGGWGQQQASFDSGKATIAVTVEAGRVSELRTERLGRIGITGNPAKLTTIFRRSVVPTEQFYQQQDAHSGRPLLRKVEEYVEFIPHYRAFAGEGLAAPACLVGCSCTERIPVDSRWGENVDVKGVEYGWKVPLHRIGALDTVYGKANILLHFQADPRAGQKEIAQRIENYERLWFYTDTRIKSVDTDTWDLIADLDYPVQMPELPPEVEPDADRAFTPVAPRGYEAFTFRLGPASIPTNLVGHLPSVGTQLNAITSQLKHVTLCRPPQALRFPERSAEKPVPTIDEWRGELDNVLNAIEEAAARPFSNEQPFPTDHITALTTTVDAELKRTEAIKEALLADVRTVEPKIAAEARKAIGANVGWALRQAENELLGSLKPIENRLLEFVQPNADLTKVQEKFEEFWKQSLGVVPGTVEHATERITAAKTWLDSTEKSFQHLLQSWTSASHPLAGVRDAVDKALQRPEAEMRREVDALAERIAALEAPIDGTGRGFDEAWSKLAALPWLRGTALKIDPGAVLAGITALRQRVHAVRLEVRRHGEMAQRDAARARAAWQAAFGRLESDVQLAAARWAKQWEAKSQELRGFRTALEGIVQAIPTDARLDSVRNALRAALTGDAETMRRNIAREFAVTAATLEQKVQTQGAKLAEWAVNNADVPKLLRTATAAYGDVADRVKEMKEELGDALKRIAGSPAAVSAWVRQQRESFEAAAQALPRQALHQINRQLAEGLTSFPPLGRSITLPRALGQVPAVPMMDFEGMAAIKGTTDATRKAAAELSHRIRSVGYRFPPALKSVDMTPVTSLLDRAKDEFGGHVEQVKLKAAALQMKVNQLTDRLESDLESLKKSALKKLLPDFGGIKLEKLAVAAGISAGLAARIKRQVKVKHDFDRQTMTGFVDAAVDNLSLGQHLTLFTLGPIALRVMDPVLNSNIRIDRGRDGGITRQEHGRLAGHWAFVIGGKPMVTFRDTSLNCHNGDLKVDLDPARMQLDGALQGIIDGAKSYSAVQGEDEPFSYGVKVEFPSITAFCRLDMVFPPVQAGSFAIMGLSLGAQLELTVRLNPVRPKESEFVIRATFNVASEELPFSIIIFILGGCGWFNLWVTYTVPFEGKPKLRLGFSVAVGVAASIGLNLGFAQGYVFVSLAIRAASDDKHSSFSAVLTFAGRLRIIGMIDVSLVIVLSIVYQAGGGLVGHGRIAVRIKICWCVTIKVERSFSYVFKKASGGGNAALPGPAPALVDASERPSISPFWNEPQPTRAEPVEAQPVRPPLRRNFVV